MKQVEQLELFTTLGSKVAIKNDVDLMSRAWFNLAKNKRFEPIEHVFRSYDMEQGVDREERIKISGSAEYGLATIWDQDVILFVISQWAEADNKRKQSSRRVRFKPYEFFKWQGHTPNGKAYQKLEQSIRRLAGTRVETTIRKGKRKIEGGFTWISDWRIISENDISQGIEIVLAEWLYECIADMKILTLDSRYFNLKGGLERWLYLYARKACNKLGWRESFRSLHEKAGVKSDYKHFAAALRRIIHENKLPEFTLNHANNERGKDLLIIEKRHSQQPPLPGSKRNQPAPQNKRPLAPSETQNLVQDLTKHFST